MNSFFKLHRIVCKIKQYFRKIIILRSEIAGNTKNVTKNKGFVTFY